MDCIFSQIFCFASKKLHFRYTTPKLARLFSYFQKNRVVFFRFIFYVRRKRGSVAAIFQICSCIVYRSTDEVFDVDRKETRCPAVVDAPVDSHIGINPRWELFLECPAFLKSELNEVDWRRLLRASLYLSISFDLFQQLFK